MDKIYALITVREHSKRLQNKCFLPLGNHSSIISWVLERALKSNFLIPIICTGQENLNRNIIEFAKEKKIKYFSGPENNKIKRWYMCAQENDLEKFHTIDCDDPFFDPNRIQDSMALLKSNYEVILPSNYSDSGSATEGFSILTKSLDFTKKMDDDSDTEMCYKFFQEELNSHKFKDPIYKIDKLRLTLDYDEDYQFIFKLASKFEACSERNLIERYVESNFKETPNYYLNKLWKDNQVRKAQNNYYNFVSRNH